jgi:tight adherence protein B
MIILTYFFIFITVSILVYFLLALLLPAVFNPYKKWQEKRTSQIADKLEDSFIFIEKKRQALFMLLPVIFLILGLLVFKFVGLLAGFIIGLTLPSLLVTIARSNRIKKFRSQLVDGMMILSSSLKGGLSINQAFEVLCEEMPAPISEEFGLIIKENKLGISLEDSLKKLRKRMPLEEVNLLVSSMLVARETGGELTRVFSRLTETIRNNIKLKEKIHTLTLQGKLQGILMSGLPIFFTAFILKQNPSHFDIMLQSQTGRILIVIAIVGQIVGMYLIKRISTIRI